MPTTGLLTNTEIRSCNAVAALDWAAIKADPVALQRWIAIANQAGKSGGGDRAEEAPKPFSSLWECHSDRKSPIRPDLLVEECGAGGDASSADVSAVITQPPIVVNRQAWGGGR